MANVFATLNPLIMKTTNRLLILMSIVFLVFIVTSCDQCQSDKEHTISFNVNTALISEDKDSIEKYSNFGQGPNISNEDYKITVKVGDIITWKGLTSTKGDVVNIVSINHVVGKNIFGKTILKGNGQDPELVVGKVLNSTYDKGNKKHDLYKYTIKFTVINNGVQRNGTFHIDPKIQVDD